MKLHQYKERVADRAGLEGDPNAGYNQVMAADDVNLFDLYYREYVENADIKDTWRKKYRQAFDEWCEFMERETSRHPTLPNEEHVEAWVDELLDRMNGQAARKQINHVKEVYEFAQNDPYFPHPTHYNPFIIVKNKRKRDLRRDPPDEFPQLNLDDIREQVESIEHVGERALTVFQLKTGVRSSELSNVQFQDLNITNADLMAHYEPLDIGTHPQVEEKSNAVYIPPKDKRDGNKREMPTVIPLDDELRRTLLDWLLIRPDNGSSHVFLTQNGKQMKPSSLLHVWRKHWRPEYEYDETEEFRSISPHYARHWFSTWFRLRASLDEPLVQYLRGDKQGAEINRTRSAFHRYVHAYYEDVEDAYRRHVFKLGL